MFKESVRITETKYIRELKKQIVKLTRENASLRKQNRRLEIELLNRIDKEEDEANNKAVEAEEAKKNSAVCPKCGDGIKPFLLRDIQYYKCHSCGSKGRVPVNNP